MNVSREIGAFVNSTFRVKIGIKSPQAYNREQFQIGQGGYNINTAEAILHSFLQARHDRHKELSGSHSH